MRAVGDRAVTGLELHGDPEASRVLLALTYAGGSSRTFRRWARSVPPGWALATVELPGHGSRMAEPCLTRVEDAAAFVQEALRSLPRRTRLSVFGYSLGGLIALELSATSVMNDEPPECLVIGASRPPGSGFGHPPVGQLGPGPEFLSRAVEYGLAAPEMLVVPDLALHFGTALFHDLAMAETYRYRGPAPLPSRLAVIGARSDPLCPPAVLAGWSRFSDEPVRRSWVDGDHLAIEHNASAVIGEVWQGLQEMTDGREEEIG